MDKDTPKEEVEEEKRQSRFATRPLSPPRYALSISPSELVAQLEGKDYVRWPNKMASNCSSNQSKYCEFHRDTRHLTVDCKALRSEIVELLKKGHPREYLSERGRKIYGLDKERGEQKDHRSQEKTPSPPLVRKVIGAICKGSVFSCDSINQMKVHQRRANQATVSSLANECGEYVISFRSNEAFRLDTPHDDTLVIKLNITNCEIGRILVDNGSSTNILFLPTLKEMEIEKKEIKKSPTLLVGFNGEAITAIGRIELLVYAAGENKLTSLLVMDYPSGYNIIMEQPWIHAMKVVPQHTTKQSGFQRSQALERFEEARRQQGVVMSAGRIEQSRLHRIGFGLA